MKTKNRTENYCEDCGTRLNSRSVCKNCDEEIQMLNSSDIHDRSSRVDFFDEMNIKRKKSKENRNIILDFDYLD